MESLTYRQTAEQIKKAVASTTDYKLIKFLYQIKKHIAILCNDLLYTFAQYNNVLT